MDNTLINQNELDASAIANSFQCNIDDLTKHVKTKGNDLTVITQNIRSIYRNFDDLQIALSTLHFNTDIIILTECRLDKDKPIPLLKGYSSSLTANLLNQNDGVVAYIRNTVKFHVTEPILVHASCLQIELHGSIILGVYRSPSNRNADDFISSLSAHINTLNKHKDLIITGDININISHRILDNTYERINKTNYLDMLAMHGLAAGHHFPTRKNNCIDHFLVKLTNKSISAHIAVFDTTITDHHMLLLVLANQKPKYIAQKTKTIIDYKEAVLSLATKNLPELLYSQDPDYVIDTLIYKMKLALGENCKIINIPKNKRCLKPWITTGILACIRNRNKMQYNLKLNPYDEILKIAYKRYRNHCNNIIKKQKRIYDRTQIANSLNNPKKFWYAVKDIANINLTKTDNCILLNSKSSPSESVAYVNEFFANIGKKLAESITPPVGCDVLSTPTVPPPIQSFGLLEVSPQEVQTILMSLKSNSSPGWDNITNSFLKLAKFHIIPVITHLVNLCFTLGVVPSALKLATVTPVYKGGVKSNVTNYRPISVLSSISKILEKLLNTRLLAYLEKFSMLSLSQFGFRKGKSTEDAIEALTKQIVNHVDRGDKCLTVFLDLRKAFDTVSVTTLLLKLERMGIRGVPLDLLRSYMSGRKQRVKIDNYVSDYTDVIFGVPQGSVLGPTLFLIYLNDLCNMSLGNASVISYADDTALIFYAATWNKLQSVTEKGLATVCCWLRDNLLTLNNDKTNFICFSKCISSQPTSNFVIKIHCCEPGQRDPCTCPHIGKLSSTKYLGVIIDQRLSWFQQIDAVSNRIRKLTWIFKSLRHVLPAYLLRRVYIVLAQSIITYCIPIWGGAVKTHFIDVERAQRSLLKVIHFKKYSFPTDRLYSISDVLSVRKLYILLATLKFHKQLPYSENNQKNRRTFRVSHRTNSTFASRQNEKQASHLFNQLNKHLNIYPQTSYNCKHNLIDYLKTLNYEQTESLLKFIT